MTATGEDATPAESHAPSTDPLKDLQVLVDANWLLTCCRTYYGSWTDDALTFFKDPEDAGALAFTASGDDGLEAPTVIQVTTEFDAATERLKAYLRQATL
ncbi:hypothetical protein [Micromonospora zamorensis]|uniref:hypothetical protein n=1 Tax=Micromonospora zamorensis TaxID=709883 RepID=UPI00378F9643